MGINIERLITDDKHEEYGVAIDKKVMFYLFVHRNKNGEVNGFEVLDKEKHRIFGEAWSGKWEDLVGL